MSLHISQVFAKDGASVAVNMHNLKNVIWDAHGPSAWVTFTDDNRQRVVFHVDQKLAEMLSDAFEDYENWLSSQEGPTFDDALAAKVSATVRESQARALK